MKPVPKKLVVFTYHYPPSAEVGAIRWHRMGAMLSARGWHVRVVAKEPDTENEARGGTLAGQTPGVERVGVVHRSSLIMRTAEALLGVRGLLRTSPSSGVNPSLPASLAVSAVSVQTKPAAPQPAAIPAPTSQSERKTIRTLLSLSHDHQWGRDAARRGRALVNEGVLVSAGPPHAVHYWVSRLAKQRGLPHIVDMRDPWSLVERSVGWMDMRLYRAVARYGEALAIRNAALVVCNTEHAASAMRAAYPECADKVVVVMNGADPEDIPSQQPWSFERFLCVHSGTIYLDRMPEALLEAARRVIDELSLTPAEFGVAFRGVVDESLQRPLAALVDSLGLIDYVQVLPRVPRDEAMRWTAEAQMCVVLPQDSRMALPSKVFELAQLPSWLLVFAPDDSATATALRGSSALVVEPADVAGASDAILAAVRQFRQRLRPQPVDASGAMQRATQVDKLEARLERIVGV
jgi:glycosyltransferase involved in cell wall biosynthesis